MLRFRCDMCRAEVPREKVTQLRLIFGGYIPGEKGITVVRELCHWCAADLAECLEDEEGENSFEARPEELQQEKEG